MSGRRLEDLPPPPDEFRMDLLCPAFETLKDARAEDELRAERLIKWAPTLEPGSRRAALRLASTLQSSRRLGVPRTLASSEYMRRLRINICGGMLPIVTAEPAFAFTVINPRRRVPSNAIEQIDPGSHLSACRAQLYRAGASSAGGILFASYHNEYHSLSDEFDGHIHGVASREMCSVIDKLRYLPQYRSSRSTGVDRGVVDPIHLGRQPMSPVPEALSYVLKSYWPECSEAGDRSKRRIREPLHVRTLLMMDRWSIKQITLMIGIKITKLGLERS